MLTPNEIRTEINQSIKGSKKFDQMVDRLVKYIIDNYSLKKNRSTEVIPTEEERSDDSDEGVQEGDFEEINDEDNSGEEIEDEDLEDIDEW